MGSSRKETQDRIRSVCNLSGQIPLKGKEEREKEPAGKPFRSWCRCGTYEWEKEVRRIGGAEQNMSQPAQWGGSPWAILHWPEITTMLTHCSGSSRKHMASAWKKRRILKASIAGGYWWIHTPWSRCLIGDLNNALPWLSQFTPWLHGFASFTHLGNRPAMVPVFITYCCV